MPPASVKPAPRRAAAIASATAPAPDTRLDAAERVILRDGIGRLTLDAVAREAGVSKGGLLHHFATKDALVDALVARAVEGWREEIERAIAAQPPGPGRISRAFLGACLSCAEAWTETVRRSGMVLVAALVHDPARVEPLRRLHRDLSARIARDGLARGVGDAVKLAVDGLWFDWLFGFAEPTAARLAAIRAALRSIVDRPGAARPSRPGRAPSTRPARAVRRARRAPRRGRAS
jgi:AcrR family transcriptional regulator